MTRVALDVIVRDDVVSLKRMLDSVRPYVDEVVIGIDGRSKLDVRAVAERYADVVHVFQADDIGLSDAEWRADKIHFANARNIGRSLVKAPWTMFLDSDEFLSRPINFRAEVAAADAASCGSVPIEVVLGDGFSLFDRQRLALTEYRWSERSHNQLHIARAVAPPCGAVISHDPSLRAPADAVRRTRQRDEGVSDLIVEARKGNTQASLHAIKHKALTGEPVVAAELTRDLLTRIPPRVEGSGLRVLAMISTALGFYRQENLEETEFWAAHALLDGPSVVAFCLLGSVCARRGDLIPARDWFKAACAIDDTAEHKWPAVTDMRFERLSAIEQALAELAAENTLLEV